MNDLIIQVDFFKKSGKWYSGGLVNIGSARLWQGRPFLQAIVDNQQILMDGWQGEFYVVTRDQEKYENDPDYREFSIALFETSDFVGIKRKERDIA